MGGLCEGESRDAPGEKLLSVGGGGYPPIALAGGLGYPGTNLIRNTMRTCNVRVNDDDDSVSGPAAAGTAAV